MVRKSGIELASFQKRELKGFMQSTKDVREYRASQGILLRAEGRTAEEVATQFNVKKDRIFVWCRNYKKKGIIGLKMGKPSGRNPKKSIKAKKVIPRLLEKEPQAFGFLKGRWVVRDIATALKEEKIDISFKQVHRILKDLDLTLKQPQLRAPGSIKKNYQKRKQIRNYRRIAPALKKTNNSHFPRRKMDRASSEHRTMLDKKRAKSTNSNIRLHR